MPWGCIYWVLYCALMRQWICCILYVFYMIHHCLMEFVFIAIQFYCNRFCNSFPYVFLTFLNYEKLSVTILWHAYTIQFNCLLVLSCGSIKLLLIKMKLFASKFFPSVIYFSFWSLDVETSLLFSFTWFYSMHKSTFNKIFYIR